MTRRLILTTATLAAFLAQGGLPAANPTPVTGRTVAAASRQMRAEPVFVGLGPHLVGIDLPETMPPGADLPVTLALDRPLAEDVQLRLWVGRKNAWGSRLATARPVAGLEAVYAGQVPVPMEPMADARLWLGLEQAGGMLVRRPVPLPGAV